jgi:hypothetical protein
MSPNKESMAWALKAWPENVYPHSYEKARRLFYRNRASMIKAGAVTRIGRDLVFDGERYLKWLRGHVKDVEGYQNPALKKHRDRIRAAQSNEA